MVVQGGGRSLIRDFERSPKLMEYIATNGSRLLIQLKVITSPNSGFLYPE